MLKKQINTMKKNYLISILLLISLIHLSSSAQELYDVKLINDTVYNHGEPQFICKSRNEKNGSLFSLRNLDNKAEAMLVFISQNDKIKFMGTFPVLQVRYSCLYPKLEIITLMDSYIRNKVFVNGKANLKGLKDYCKERNLVLDTLIARKVQSPMKRDSVMVAHAREDALSQIKFTFHNNASKPVRVFIGNKPKGGSGRIQIIAPHGELNEHARKTEKIFLINDEGEEIKSLSVTDSLKRIVIKESADGFE